MKLKAIFICATLVTCTMAYAQKQVTIDPNSKVYEGGFFRINVGLTPGSGSYQINGSDVYSGGSVTPLYIDGNFGKRINRSVAAYFKMYGHVILKEAGYFTTFSVAGMGLGSNIYVKNSNYYIAPEVSLAILNFVYSGIENNAGDLGINITLKSGKDWHLAGHTFVGTQVFLTYYNTSDIDAEDYEAGGSGFHYGIALSLKLGK